MLRSRILEIFSAFSSDKTSTPDGGDFLGAGSLPGWSSPNTVACDRDQANSSAKPSQRLVRETACMNRLQKRPRVNAAETDRLIITILSPALASVRDGPIFFNRDEA